MSHLEFKPFVDLRMRAAGFEDVTSWKGMLIEPIQRVIRYENLVERLLSKTPFSHPDFELLTTATADLKAVNQFLNRELDQARILEPLYSLEMCFDERVKIARVGRSILFTGDAMLTETKYRPTDSLLKPTMSSAFPVTVWVFSDILVVGRIKGNKERESVSYSLINRSFLAMLSFDYVDEDNSINVLF